MPILASFSFGCGVYSFTGASVSPDIKTVTVSYFANTSSNGSTALNQGLTDILKDKFVSETNLVLQDRGGDIEFRGTVTRYTIKAGAPTATQTTAINRLTVNVKVEYLNRLNDAENWSKEFSQFEDYENTESLTDVEDDLIISVNEQLAELIFNEAFVNW